MARKKAKDLIFSKSTSGFAAITLEIKVPAGHSYRVRQVIHSQLANTDNVLYVSICEKMHIMLRAGSTNGSVTWEPPGGFILAAGDKLSINATGAVTMHYLTVILDSLHWAVKDDSGQ